MKFIILIPLIALLVWVLSIAWANRRKSPYDNSDSSGGYSGDSGDSFSSHCHGSDTSCEGGGDSGGGDGGGGD